MSKKPEKFKEIYQELCLFLMTKEIFVEDQSMKGFALLIKDFPLKGLIYIDPKLSYKKKYQVLLHEMGHFFTLSKNNLKLRKSLSSEKQADAFAKEFLKKEINDIYLLMSTSL